MYAGIALLAGIWGAVGAAKNTSQLLFMANPATGPEYALTSISACMIKNGIEVGEEAASNIATGIMTGQSIGDSIRNSTAAPEANLK
ncbi:unnamed protein product [Sphagnum balticum]